MSKASKLIKAIDEALNRFDTFGDDPDAFVINLILELEVEIEEVLDNGKPKQFQAIYVERDRARIKEKILNHVMAQHHPTK